MKSNVVFGIIAVLIAGIAWAVLVGGWIYLIRTYGQADATDVSCSSTVPIMQQVVLLTIALVIGVGGASLLMPR